jgi:hypothetical protein
MTLYFTTAPLGWLSLLRVLWVVSGSHRDIDKSYALMGGYKPLPFLSTQKGAEFNYIQIVQIALFAVPALEEALDLSNTAHKSVAGSSNPWYWDRFMAVDCRDQSSLSKSLCHAF